MFRVRHKLGIHILIILFTFAVFVSPVGAAEVKDLKSYHRGRDIILKYRLKALGQEKSDKITMKVSLDSGNSWMSPRGVFGDIGDNIAVGSGKMIIWSVLEDFPKGLDRKVIFSVEAAGGKDLRQTDIKKWIEPITGMAFVWVPAGCYEMGQTKEGKRQVIKAIGKKKYEEYYSDELPRHEVCVDGLWMGKHEVTNEQYRKYQSGHNSKDYKGRSLNGDRQPAVYVSWNDAKEFAKWLTRQSNNRYEFRLPIEAEWEYAGRAGKTASRYWGEDPGDACRYANVHDQTSKRINNFEWQHHNCDDGYAVTAPAGSFEANAFDLHDMLGNVWEWCEDIYSKNAYSKHKRNNPIYTEGGSDRVIRGGSWSYGPRYVRSAFRSRYEPVSRFSFIGFRLLRTR